VSFGRGWLPEAAGSAPLPGDAPPLRIWIVSALVVAAFLATSVVSFVRYEDPFVPYNAARVAAFATGKPGTYTVVALGDSRLKYATLNQPEIAALAAAFGVPDLRFLRLVNNAATYDDFEGLQEAVLASRPDLLLIQLDLVLRKRALLRRYEEYKRYLERWLRHLLRDASLDHDPQHLQVATSCPKDAARERLWPSVRTFERLLHVDPSSRNFRAALKFAGRAVQAGSDVVLLEIRTSPELRAFYRGTGLDDRAALKRLQRASDLPLWRFPAELVSSQHFCDYIHLDEEARARFSEWLVGRIAAAARAG
jgi:hypothetical protein